MMVACILPNTVSVGVECDGVDSRSEGGLALSAILDYMAHHRGLLTLQDWDALPEDDEFHTEVAEGVLIVSAKPVSRHQRVAFQLAVALEHGLPPTLRQVQEVDVVLRESPLTVRSPDLVVIRVDAAERNPKRFDASDVIVAIEVHSDATLQTDQVMKRVEYADAGIAQYWMVDPEAPRLTAFELRAYSYHLVGEYTGTVDLDVGGASITVDVDRLPRWS